MEMGMRIGNSGIGRKWECEQSVDMGMVRNGMGSTLWEWEGMDTVMGTADLYCRPGSNSA